LILDEAHAAVPARSETYASDGRLTRTVREIAPLFDHRLFLSATTPARARASLLEMLGADGLPDDAIVRRTKGDLRAAGVGVPRRRVVPIVVDGVRSSPAVELGRILEQYREATEAQPGSARTAARRVVAALQRRLLSSVEAFATGLHAHVRAAHA